MKRKRVISTLVIASLLLALEVALSSASCVCLREDQTKNSENSELTGYGFGMPNPAAVYCTELGYKYEIKNTKEGQVGICIFPDKSSCDAWEFYSGKRKGEFSYCARRGYKLKTKKNCAWASEGSVCVLPDGEENPAFILMLKEKPETEKGYLRSFLKEESHLDLESGSSSEGLSQISSVGLPSSFDWRTKDGGDWLTPVKDQGGCGSCWAFASVGAHESQIDIKSNDPGIDKDLAEQYLVSDCFPPGDCGGLYLSDMDNLFDFHRDNGIVDEDCYPYIAANSPCSPCADWATRLRDIKSWYSVSANRADIQTALTTEGPLWVGLYMSGTFYDGIMRCTSSQDADINHAVVIVGYNDVGEYWIVRNSWGADWGPEGNGYFKVGYGECNIDTYIGGYEDIVAFVGKPEGPVDDPPTVSITSPIDGATVSGSLTIEATANDDVGVEKVEFYYDSTLIGTDIDSPYSVEWDSTNVVDGSYTIKAIAYDTIDQTTTDTISVLVANAHHEWRRRQITITSTSATALTYYQVRVVVDYDSDMQPDFDDLRFTNADNSVKYDYWIESKSDGSSATVWVEVPHIPTGDSTMYIWYGNWYASSESNGDATFVFFDDFETGSIDTTKWNEINTGWSVVTDGGSYVLKSPPGKVLTKYWIEAKDLNMQKCELGMKWKAHDVGIGGGWPRPIAKIDYSDGGSEDSYRAEYGITSYPSAGDRYKLDKFVDGTGTQFMRVRLSNPSLHQPLPLNVRIASLAEINVV